MLCYAKSFQSCRTLCDPMDGSPPGSAVPGILQARILEWAAISFSNAWKRKVKVKSLSHVQLLATPWTAAYLAPLSMDFPGKSTGVGCHCFLRHIKINIFKTNMPPSPITALQMSQPNRKPETWQSSLVLPLNFAHVTHPIH